MGEQIFELQRYEKLIEMLRACAVLLELKRDQKGSLCGWII